ncbi:UNVERIFIED_CONTAM: hypothetical protein FKN15_027754, partial [Acipenser sinensis]
DLLWKKDSQKLAKFNNGKFTPYFGFENRAEVFPNGTLKLAMINNNDTGLYLLEVFNKEGINILKESIHLHTQVSQPEKNSTCEKPGEAELVCAVEEGDSVYFHWNEVPSKNTNDQETVFIDLICTVAVEKRSRSAGRVATVVCLAGTFVIIIFMLILKELKTKNQNKEKEYVDMRQTRAMVALDISDPSEKEYVDMRQTRAMAALDISDTSEKEYVDMRETRAMAALDILNTSEKGKLLYH